MCVFFQTQLTELAAAYKKVHKVELADEIEKKCSGDLKTTLLAKLGKKGNLFFFFSRSSLAYFVSLFKLSSILFLLDKVKEKQKKQKVWK